MSDPLKQGEGPFLGSLSARIRKLDPCTEGNLGLQTGDFVSLNKQPKHFNDGPLPPLSPNQEENGLLDGFKTPDLNISKEPSFQPQVGNYIQRLVKRTSKEGLVDLAENIPRLTSGTTGAIVVEGFEPTCDLYEESLHFLLEEKGSFGSGDLCLDGKSLKRFVRKTMLVENFKSSEVTVPINLYHENVTKLYGLIRRNEEGQDSIVELLIEPAGMSLNAYAQKYTIETPRIWDITRQTMAGLNHMHNYEMIHFDIKPETICIEEREGKCCIVKITDFGSAKLPQEQMQFNPLTVDYMCPETSQLFLQKRRLMKGVIKESDITGKVDIFAAALVIMYLYGKVHVLQRLITSGQTSYNDYDDKTRTSPQLDLMRMLAKDSDIIQYIIPDACDIDMRELLEGMTQHDPQQRCSAQDAINFIDMREQRKREVIKECLRKLQQQQNEKARIRDSSSSLPNFDLFVTEVPEIAYNYLKMDNGPIKKSTNAALREKLRPYPGKGKVKVMKVETPVQELRHMDAASKQMEDFPCIPISEDALSLAKLNTRVLIQQMLTKGPVKILLTEKEQELVQVQQTQTTVTQNRSGVRPVMPASPPNMTHGELELPEVSGSKEMAGNVPDFMKLG